MKRASELALCVHLLRGMRLFKTYGNAMQQSALSQGEEHFRSSESTRSKQQKEKQ